MPYAEGEEGSASVNPGSKSRKNLENMCTKCFSSVVNKDLDEFMLETNICVRTGVYEDCLYIVLIVAWLFTKATSTCVTEVNGRKGWGGVSPLARAGKLRGRRNECVASCTLSVDSGRFRQSTVPNAVTFLPCFPHPWNKSRRIL